jgi:hypothetical protein
MRVSSGPDVNRRAEGLLSHPVIESHQLTAIEPNGERKREREREIFVGQAYTYLSPWALAQGTLRWYG